MKRLQGPLVVALLAVGCTPAQPTQPTQPTASPSASPAPAASQAPANVLSGIVYDDNEQPLSGVTVEISRDGAAVQTAETGPDGRYQVTVPAGDYRVAASKADMVKREQAVSVAGATSLNFGGWKDNYVNPFFLSSYPEIREVSVEEKAPGGPMALKLHLSEPLPGSSREHLVSRLELRARNDAPFLRPAGVGVSELEMTTEWDASGQNLTLHYDEPYLASGELAAIYTLRLTQFEKDTKDPVTRENEWEDMRIVDEAGMALGRNRADFAFLKPELTAFPVSFLADKNYGYSPEIRRWNLTHTSSFAFEAAKDTTGPGVTSVRVDGNKVLGSTTSDVMTLRFTEPMRVVKNRDELQFTQLDVDTPLQEMFVINVSKLEDGGNPQPLVSVSKVSRFRFSTTDPNVVYVHFPPNTFKDMKWVEVTLADEARDPANNKPEGDQLQVSGPVTSPEE